MKGVLAANDPVAVYPLKGTAKDVSMCNNEEAEMFDEAGSKMSVWPDRVTFTRHGLRTIRITNNDGNLNVKSLTILIRIRTPLQQQQAGGNTIVQFFAQGKSVLQLLLHENNLNFFMYSRSDGEHLSAKLMMTSNGNMKIREWYSVAATYSHVTGNVTLYSNTGGFSNGFLGLLEVEEPEYVYLGNNMESVTEASNEHHSPGRFFGRMECFMLYRRNLNFSEIRLALNLCQELLNDNQNDDDDDDRSGGKLSYLFTLFILKIG